MSLVQRRPYFRVSFKRGSTATLQKEKGRFNPASSCKFTTKQCAYKQINYIVDQYYNYNRSPVSDRRVSEVIQVYIATITGMLEVYSCTIIP